MTFPLNIKGKVDSLVNFPIDTSLKTIAHSAVCTGKLSTQVQLKSISSVRVPIYLNAMYSSWEPGAPCVIHKTSLIPQLVYKICFLHQRSIESCFQNQTSNPTKSLMSTFVFMKIQSRFSA